MAFSYRKSFKAGPFRATVSKSGVGYSAGVKGARVTKRADGRVQTTLSAPGTGLRYTSTSRTGRPNGPAVDPQRALTPPVQPIHFAGMRSSITLHPDRIEIRRSRLKGGTHLNLPWSEVIDVESVRPTFFGGSGYVHIVTRTLPRLLAAPGQRDFPAALHSPTTVTFSNFPSGIRTHRALLAALRGF